MELGQENMSESALEMRDEVIALILPSLFHRLNNDLTLLNGNLCLLEGAITGNDSLISKALDVSSRIEDRLESASRVWRVDAEKPQSLAGAVQWAFSILELALDPGWQFSFDAGDFPDTELICPSYTGLALLGRSITASQIKRQAGTIKISVQQVQDSAEIAIQAAYESDAPDTGKQLSRADLQRSLRALFLEDRQALRIPLSST